MSWHPLKVRNLAAITGLFTILTSCGLGWPQTPTDRANVGRDGQTQSGPADKAPDTPAQASPIDDIQSANWNPTGDPDKAAILESPEWQNVMQRLTGWLSVQKVYTNEEVNHLQRDIGARVTGMNAQELQKFQGELNTKLDILLSQEALDARSWITRRMSLLSEKRAEELREGLPDVTGMTPEQMEAALAQFRAERAADAHTAQANQYAAQQRSASLSRQRSNQSARSQPSRAATFGQQQPPPRRQGWVPNQRYRAADPPRSFYYLNRVRPYRW
jgi:hypothetical protein